MQIKVELQGSRFNNQHVYIYIYYSNWLRFSLSPEKWTDDRDSGTARSMIRIYIYIINYIFRCVALYIYKYIYPFPWLKHQSWFWDLISIELENQIKSSTWFPSFAYHLERKEIISHLDIAFEPVLLPSYMALLALAPTYPELASPAESQSSQNRPKVGALQHSSSSLEAPGSRGRQMVGPRLIRSIFDIVKMVFIYGNIEEF